MLRWKRSRPGLQAKFFSIRKPSWVHSLKTHNCRKILLLFESFKVNQKNTAQIYWSLKSLIRLSSCFWWFFRTHLKHRLECLCQACSWTHAVEPFQNIVPKIAKIGVKGQSKIPHPIVDEPSSSQRLTCAFLKSSFTCSDQINSHRFRKRKLRILLSSIAFRKWQSLCQPWLHYLRVIHSRKRFSHFALLLHSTWWIE